ncbi:MAG: L-threonylcarbamoyladenylate synthase [Chloracidobacterium sp.]|uniref:Threonylcarbamoyl-AMP synthase n=1 Tax=Chloracidobacterium validum TaxID=2821543 RepID=A0ABX8BEC1_9BACT|nr:L-threonylcarbamoyladenylate synthase [Chloracidobacterium validum]QUW03420.1 threonylcarbamoyl-AMP synthase [Chloracidobacterium validum]
MLTERIICDPHHPDPVALMKAADLLRAGQLVAFPTETVYGLGALAFDETAVARVFAAKGRPPNNPLIVHIAERSWIERVAVDIPPVAYRLMDVFFPGPLTLILHKQARVPPNVTGGGATVGVRLPAHPLAQSLIRAVGAPLAAPSANRFTEVSPTTADHVLKSLGGRIAAVLDGGPCAVGIESAVLDVTTTPPTLWRAGVLAQSTLEASAGEPFQSPPHTATAPSPGQFPRHYAPRARVELQPFGDIKGIEKRLAFWSARGRRLGAVVLSEVDVPPDVTQIRLPSVVAAYAQQLYAALHALDGQLVDIIVIEQVPATAEWDGVRDRLIRAAHEPLPS